MGIVSCNLHFDTPAERAVLDLCQRLAGTGLPAKGASGYPPHITVTAYATDEPETMAAEFAARLAPVAASLQWIPLRLESVGVFPEAGVVYLAPRVSRALLEAHRAVIDTLAGPSMPAFLDDLLLPDRWTPHVTLAGHLDDEQIARIVAACLRDWRPIHGEAVGLGVRVHPDVTDTHRIPLGS